MSKTIVPLNKQVLVAPPEKRASAIILQTQEDTPERGVVKAVADGVTDLDVGDEIFFKKYSLDEIDFDGEKVLLIGAEQVLAKIVKE